ncbi:high light inducible protein [Microcystis elabens FACHB-917]|nr:high light inducible protein [Microcystis elabens FACHB-917]
MAESVQDSSRRQPDPDAGSTTDPTSPAPRDTAFYYEPLERFGEGLTTSRPWNLGALAGVERLNGRVAMIGFAAALIGEAFTGRGILGQLALMLRWLLG